MTCLKFLAYLDREKGEDIENQDIGERKGIKKSFITYPYVLQIFLNLLKRWAIVAFSDIKFPTQDVSQLAPIDLLLMVHLS